MSENAENRTTECTTECSECKWKAELADVKAMMMSMESNHAEVVKGLERKYNDEVASMQVLLNEAAAEATSLASRKFEQEREKLFQNSNDMESEISRLRKMVIENARVHQQNQEADISAESAQQFEDEIEMLKIQLATANQEISKLTLFRDKAKPNSPTSETQPQENSNTETVLRTEETEGLFRRISESENEIKQLLRKLAAAESKLASLRSSTTEGFSKAKQELNKLREKFQSVVEVNRRLTFHYAQKSRELREEEINLPASFDELLSSALQLREQVILERANREVLKEKTSQDIDILRSELVAEQNEKQQMEQLLSIEIDSLRAELAKNRNASPKETSQGLTNPSNQGVVVDAEYESVKRERDALEAEVNNLRGQCARLQVELDTSESVQQDLVRLSQSLQVSLEGLRNQSEVRWEFDDEVDQCKGCKKTLPLSQQKLHCRHCGKIFCGSCLSHSVPSGASRRPARVCTQCHFLLVQEARPYYSENSET